MIRWRKLGGPKAEPKPVRTAANRTQPASMRIPSYRILASLPTKSSIGIHVMYFCCYKSEHILLYGTFTPFPPANFRLFMKDIQACWEPLCVLVRTAAAALPSIMILHEWLCYMAINCGHGTMHHTYIKCACTWY